MDANANQDLDLISMSAYVQGTTKDWDDSIELSDLEERDLLLT